MKIGGDGQFRFPLSMEPAVEGDDRAQQPAVDLQQQFLVLSGEMTAFAGKLAEGRVMPAGGLPGPGEKEPYLEVEDVLVREGAGAVDPVGARAVPRHVQKFQVPPVGFDHPLPVGGEEVVDDETPVLGCHGRRVHHEMKEEGVGRAPFGIVQDLFQERRDEVEGRHGPFAFLHDGRHVVVILHGVEIGPGQGVIAHQGVPVQRLVHVPDEYYVQGRGHVRVTPSSRIPPCPGIP